MIEVITTSISSFSKRDRVLKNSIAAETASSSRRLRKEASKSNSMILTNHLRKRQQGKRTTPTLTVKKMKKLNELRAEAAAAVKQNGGQH